MEHIHLRASSNRFFPGGFPPPERFILELEWKIIAWDKAIFPFLLGEIQKYHIGKSTTLVGISIKDILGVYPIGKSITLVGISTKDILSDCGNYHQETILSTSYGKIHNICWNFHFYHKEFLRGENPS